MSMRHIVKKTLQQIFIANLRKFRNQQGISQMTLSERCDTTSNYIGQIEMGRRIPSFEKIEKIAAALDIAPSLLFIGEDFGERNSETRNYLRKMPVDVKEEIFSRIFALIKEDIAESLDAEKY